MSTARVKANRVRSRVCPARGGSDGDPDPRRCLFVWRSLRLAHAATNVVDHLANRMRRLRSPPFQISRSSLLAGASRSELPPTSTAQNSGKRLKHPSLIAATMSSKNARLPPRDTLFSTSESPLPPSRPSNLRPDDRCRSASPTIRGPTVQRDPKIQALTSGRSAGGSASSPRMDLGRRAGLTRERTPSVGRGAGSICRYIDLVARCGVVAWLRKRVGARGWGSVILP
jgi:hypothetical protein